MSTLLFGLQLSHTAKAGQGSKVGHTVSWAFICPKSLPTLTPFLCWRPPKSITNNHTPILLLVSRPVRLVRFLKCTKQMGLHIHSLEQLPAMVEWAYYVYLLDYGWNEPLGAAERGADAAEQDAEHVAS